MKRHGRVLAQLATLGALCVVVTLTLLASYYVADHDRRHGGQTPDEGWEDVVIVGLGAIVAVTPAIAAGLTVGRVPRGKLLAVAGVAGLVAVVAWWSWITTIVD
jgi:hypothetical protein